MIIAIRDVTFTEHLIIQNGILLLFKINIRNKKDGVKCGAEPNKGTVINTLNCSRGSGKVLGVECWVLDEVHSANVQQNTRGPLVACYARSAG